jgi:hypothetical protein
MKHSPRRLSVPKEDTVDSPRSSTKSSTVLDSETVSSSSNHSIQQQMTSRYKMKGLGSLLKMYSKALSAIESDYADIKSNVEMQKSARRSKLVGLRRKMQGILMSLSDTLSQAADDIDL